MEKVREYLLSEDGQGMVEYALIIAFVAIVAALVLQGNLSNTINNLFGTADQKIQDATNSAGGTGGGTGD